jgi:hypothetical protein
MKNDPGLAAVRAARIEISRQFGNDPARLVAHYVEMQARYKGSLLIEGPGTTSSDANASVATDGIAPNR